MLTLCRTLMGDPDLIMIDEPTEGLAPKIVELVAEFLRELQATRHLGAAGRAEADHRAGGVAALSGHGPRPASSSRARPPNCGPTPQSARSGSRSSLGRRVAPWRRLSLPLQCRAHCQLLESHERSPFVRTGDISHDSQLRSSRRRRRGHDEQPAGQRPGLRHARAASPTGWTAPTPIRRSRPSSSPAPARRSRAAPTSASSARPRRWPNRTC